MPSGFEKLKDIFATESVLKLLNSEEPFMIHADTSDVAMVQFYCREKKGKDFSLVPICLRNYLTLRDDGQSGRSRLMPSSGFFSSGGSS